MATSRFAPRAPSRVRWGLKVGACAAPDEKGIASEGAASEADGSFDAVAYINTPRWQTSRLGLERIEDLLERMGRPQDALRFVHVAGTNGKGSTCAYLSSVLASAGFKTGLFTSPYVEVFEERIRVDGENISRDDLVRATLVVREHACAMEAETGEHPTEFELMTAVAFEHFRTVGCDIVVLEVGLGGRLDSTNVIERPEVCVICRIGLDHTAVLGGTLAAVAGEKAGIIKPGVAVASWPQEPEAREVVAAVARDRGCALTEPDFSQLVVGSIDAELAVRSFTYRGKSYETALLGAYQPGNAALALEAVGLLRARGWDIPEEAVRAGIARTTWPGRFEVVARDPLVIVDGGHNPQGAEVLADSLRELVEGGNSSSRRVAFVMGVLADKDYPPMIRSAVPFARAFFVYAPENPRALSAEDLAAAVRSVVDDRTDAVGNAVEGGAGVRIEAALGAADAVRKALDFAGEGDVVVAFGSLYSLGEVKRTVLAG